MEHAGTTDVDVHVEIEAQAGDPDSAPRLEAALRTAGFVPDKERIWRWQTIVGHGRKAVIKFELLTDNPNAEANATISLPGCERLGAANLRGTGYASMDTAMHTLAARIDGELTTVDINVTGLGGFLLAKLAAAHGRRKAKDWYDIAYVLLHNDAGGPQAAAAHIEATFPGVFRSGSPRTWLVDARANFHDDRSQGTEAYADEALLHQPDEERAQLLSLIHISEPTRPY